jgi:DNA polymerase-1
MEHNKKTWLLVDGHNMAFRCFYGVPEMITADGIPTNAVYGWVRSLWKLEDLIMPDGVCIFFDSGGSVAKRSILPTYKGNRKDMPDGLKQQLSYLNLMSVANGYHVIFETGIEADDLLATFARQLNEYNEISYIASGDKDFAQCVGPNIYQILPPSSSAKGIWRVLDKDGVKEKFGIFPEQVVDYLSLLGDAADNIPGVPGIGQVRATALLNEFCSIDHLLQKIGTIQSDRIRQSLVSSLDLIERNRALIELKNVDKISIPEAKINRSEEDIINLLKTLQLNSLLTAAKKRYTQQSELFNMK